MGKPSFSRRMCLHEGLQQVVKSALYLESAKQQRSRYFTWPPSQEKTVLISPDSSLSRGLISILVILALPNI